VVSEVRSGALKLPVNEGFGFQRSRPDLVNSQSTKDPDPYAKGMVFTTDDQEGLTPELDRFQFELFRRYLGRRILEVGGGAGRMTELVRLGVEPSEFVTIEPSAHFVEMLDRRYATDTSMKVMRATTSDVVDEYRGHFDSVFSVHVMEHVEDDGAFVRECLAMTKPGGTVIVLVPALQFLYSNLDRNIGHYRRYDKKMVRRLVADLDVSIEKLQYNNLIGVLASAWFIKFRKLEYQTSAAGRGRFFRLYGLYSRFVIPVVSAIERIIAPPVGLNLTVVLRKRNDPN
jgi:SAM-dependent methyltransferase